MVMTRLWTADEVALLDEDERGELIDGEFYRVSPVQQAHGATVLTAGRVILDHVSERDLGVVFTEVGFVLDHDGRTLLAPDIAYIAKERHDPDLQPWLLGPPDLAVEVNSPSNRPRFVAEKVQRYLAAGCPLVWEMRPTTRSVIVHRPGQDPITLGPDDEIAGGEVLPEFRARVRELFPNWLAQSGAKTT